jgi:hypothetical protein
MQQITERPATQLRRPAAELFRKFGIDLDQAETAVQPGHAQTGPLEERSEDFLLTAPAHRGDEYLCHWFSPARPVNEGDAKIVVT